ncbi:MAG: acyl-CoA thioesterase [Desulfohalobiaceae bacterium]
MPANSSKNCEKYFVVPFHDLDPMGVMWHGNYFKYLDATRDSLFQSLGLDLYQVSHDTQYIFPIIRSSIKHVFPLRFRDEFICQATLKEVSHKITVTFELRLSLNSWVVAKAKSEQAAVKMPEMQTMFQIPEHIKQALGF